MDVESREVFCVFVFAMGEITACLYIDKNDPAERGKLMMRERGEVCCSNVLEWVSGHGTSAQEGWPSMAMWTIEP